MRRHHQESSLDKGKKNSQQGPLSRSVCKLQFTEKGKQLRDETAKKQLKAFLKSCHSWKETARDVRSKLKKFCGAAELDEINIQIQSRYDHVTQNYELLQRNSINTEAENGLLFHTHNRNMRSCKPTTGSRSR